MELKCKLDELIKERGLKKGFIAEQAGISKTTLSVLISGRSLPTLTVAFKIAKVLGLKIEEIWIPKGD
ncbi:helix-turn-helix transcriptional regulator [Fictibacillus gelatini]|uniref:helix-turn-helix transcriptional regulator n=1 Tax=Fictibacillus gelatini TaxID=225985 RepID=UPI000407ABCB|nr:helix-turn-helix domain-containing protein [Fictibacillus gelatini]